VQIGLLPLVLSSSKAIYAEKNMRSGTFGENIQFGRLTGALVASGLMLSVTGRSQQTSSDVPSQPMQDASKMPYMNPSLPIEQRVDDLLKHMTIDEKVTQLVNQSRAVPRLGVPAYDWWSESLHGVAVNGTTEFPEPIGLDAIFDPATIHETAVAIGTEGRIKQAQNVHAGHSNIFEGLDFWAPNINIFRDPRWGRGQETYGEDPFLTTRMGVAFVTEMQGDDPKYYRVIATSKHFTSQLEGEEMPVTLEGFKGGDRTSLDLPRPEQELLEAVARNCRGLVFRRGGRRGDC
jgi:hypothetical protein